MAGWRDKHEPAVAAFLHENCKLLHILYLREQIHSRQHRHLDAKLVEKLPSKSSLTVCSKGTQS